MLTRKKELSTGNPNQIFIIGFIRSGTRGLENQLHKQYEYAKVKGEWFKPCASLLDYINNTSDMMAEVTIENGTIYVLKKMKCV